MTLLSPSLNWPDHQMIKTFMPVKPLLLLLLLLLLLHGSFTTATWCVARSDASREALQTALDYACNAGADCAPLQPSGLCFLPNTIQAHASYAYNSYYMRRFMAPGSCDFSGTATFAKTDPSYGSCVYPPSPRYAMHHCFIRWIDKKLEMSRPWPM